MSNFPFISRRSPVISLHGSAASANPLVSEIGARILRFGGNAADAAVAMAAALNVVQPCSTGIGGDCFCQQRQLLSDWSVCLVINLVNNPLVSRAAENDES